MTVDEATLRRGLDLTLDGTRFAGLGELYEGKVRDNYTTNDGRRIIVVTDRISAFDRVLGTLPFKGQVLNGLAAWWFEQTRDVAPNHLLDVPDPNVMVGVECVPLEVELVDARVRDGRHIDQHLDPLRARRARLLRAPASRTD